MQTSPTARDGEAQNRITPQATSCRTRLPICFCGSLRSRRPGGPSARPAAPRAYGGLEAGVASLQPAVTLPADAELPIRNSWTKGRCTVHFFILVFERYGSTDPPPQSRQAVGKGAALAALPTPAVGRDWLIQLPYALPFASLSLRLLLRQPPRAENGAAWRLAATLSASSSSFINLSSRDGADSVHFRARHESSRRRSMSALDRPMICRGSTGLILAARRHSCCFMHEIHRAHTSENRRPVLTANNA